MINFIKLLLVFFVTNAVAGPLVAALVALVFFWDTVWNVIFILLFAFLILAIFP
jgi:hypothetical protein